MMDCGGENQEVEFPLISIDMKMEYVQDVPYE